MTSREARRQRRKAERKALKSAKGADARRQPTEKHARSLAGALDSAPVLRALPQHSRKAEAATASQDHSAPEPVTAHEPTLRAETNRRNAQSSTGPRTPQGKLASSRNSFKHGLYSKALVLPSEDPAELDALKADLRAEHQPGNTTEEILVNELAEQFWRIRRMRRYETEALVGDTKYENWFSLMALIQRTMASAERGFHKALTTLRQIQKARGFVPQESATPQHEQDEAALLSEPKTQTKVFVPHKTQPITPDEDPTFAERFAELKEFEEILTSRAA